jgi:pimeloyl-ACP methyl ester carboxylesterase
MNLKVLGVVVAALLQAAPALGQIWRELPDPGPMPTVGASGDAPINGVKIHYAVFGAGAPILLIHNGLGDADDWARVIPPLARRHRVIVADTRGFGRSTRDATPYSYDLLASDYLGLLDHLGISRVVVVGTSDGGIIGLDLAMHHPDRLAGLFAQGANADVGGIQRPSDLTAIRLAVARSRREYERLSATPQDYAAFRAALDKMDVDQPAFTAQDLGRIRTPTVIAAGDHEESITAAHTAWLVRSIPGARFVELHGVSHFAPLQDPAQFAAAVLRFVDALPPWGG